jgi:hypothetical protein
MSYRFVDSFRPEPSLSCSKAVYKPVIYTSAECAVSNSWWWAEELPETCRVSCQNKFVKLVHLVGFIVKKFVTMHGHTNVKKKLHHCWPIWTAVHHLYLLRTSLHSTTLQTTIFNLWYYILNTTLQFNRILNKIIWFELCSDPDTL